MAREKSIHQLMIGYHNSEEDLRNASIKGDKKALKRAMKTHGNYEYAMLYRNTPEYKNNK